ncbi:hypothetical protein EF405_12020 [Cyclobacteriaceae bacterium YHN15]|nr:hypothetical protein EF405_12020 [Cyclobacteriaceae bacterium YHN15]
MNKKKYPEKNDNSTSKQIAQEPGIEIYSKNLNSSFQSILGLMNELPKDKLETLIKEALQRLAKREVKANLDFKEFSFRLQLWTKTNMMNFTLPFWMSEPANG